MTTHANREPVGGAAQSTNWGRAIASAVIRSFAAAGAVWTGALPPSDAALAASHPLPQSPTEAKVWGKLFVDGITSRFHRGGREVS